MKRFYLILVLTLLTLLPAHAASLHTIQLQNRQADEIIPIVEPMLGAGEVITGRGYKIFLRASAQTLAEVQEIIDALDIAAKMLQISVFQGSERSLEKTSASANLRIETGAGSIGVGNNDGNGAGNINYSDGNISGEISASTTRQRSRSNPVHQLRIAEGAEGFIETGKQIPFFGLEGGYQAVTTGFYVLPRVSGDRVTLRVSPFKNALSRSGNGSIDTQSANTIISGRLGEWLQIGGVSSSSSSSRSGIGSYSSSNSESEDGIWIRAELLR